MHSSYIYLTIKKCDTFLFFPKPIHRYIAANHMADNYQTSG